MSDESVREHAVSLLSGHGAHLPFERAVADVPEKLRGVVPEGASASLWQQLEHLRIAQWDILEFSRDPGHVSPEFPGGYWPDSVAPPAGAWQRSVDAFLADRDAMIALIRDPPGGPVSADPARHRPDPAARGAGAGRPQRLPRGADRAAAAPAEVLVGEPLNRCPRGGDRCSGCGSSPAG